VRHSVRILALIVYLHGTSGGAPHLKGCISVGEVYLINVSFASLFAVNTQEDDLQ
jgi:hypothetical protein